MAVEIYGMSSANTAMVKKYLDDLVSQECISKNVKSSHLSNLPESDQKSIVTLSQSNEVSVLVAGPDRWTISGKKDDVLDAVLKINIFIQEARDREIRDSEVKRLRQTLCWEVVRGETWQPLDPSISYEVELSYHKKNKTFQYQQTGQTYTIDFKEMTVMNDSKKECSSRIKRTLLADCDTGKCLHLFDFLKHKNRVNTSLALSYTHKHIHGNISLLMYTTDEESMHSYQFFKITHFNNIGILWHFSDV